jgi:DMSO/TMAO reductase YedYZ molybdopterin-dependent catalytic subunit
MKSLTKSVVAKPSRREFLRASMLGSGALLIGFDGIGALLPVQKAAADAFTGGKQLGFVEFAGESRTPTDLLFNEGLDARLYSDLSALSPEHPVTTTEKFYVRTSASSQLPSAASWTVKLAGLVDKPLTLPIDELQKAAKPMGLHLMECSGNAKSTRFGLLSVADWAGVGVSDLLDTRVKPRSGRVMFSGFDQYPGRSITSIPGADWIFTLDQLKAANAFLATQMNDQPLTPDHGAPVRLVVPGWYGCTCIKWLNAITFVADDAEATSQMQEFAGRTHQQGIPRLARDFKPASMDQAAMPIRAEKWQVSEKIKYRVVGILWGGSRPIKNLEIRFNPEEEYVRVDSFAQTVNDPLSFWSHAWAPAAPGTYSIRLRVGDPGVPTKRLDLGYYVRTVEITDI